MTLEYPPVNASAMQRSTVLADGASVNAAADTYLYCDDIRTRMQQSTLTLFDSQNGWIATDGTWHPCEYEGHVDTIYNLTKDGVINPPDGMEPALWAERTGWIHVSYAYFDEGWVPPTQKQLDTLFDYAMENEYMGAYRTFMEAHGNN